MSKDSDTAQDYRALTEHRKEQRTSRYAGSIKNLHEADIEFQAKNQGYHLIIERKGHRFDFWPSTGRWKALSGTKGHGVDSLINFIGRIK